MESEEHFVTVDNLDAVCRICLRFDSDMINIFESGINNQLTEVTKLKIKSDDQLPKTICRKCHTQMDNFFKFIYQAKSTDAYLRDLINQQKIKQEEKPKRKVSKKKQVKGKKETDQMYLIVVPNKNTDSEISIKDLSSNKDELTLYCRNLVNNGFSDHTYPKERDDKVYLLDLDVYKCNCNQSFEELKELQHHLKNHEGAEYTQADYECPVCRFKESERNVFMSHIENHQNEGLTFLKMSGGEITTQQNNQVFCMNISSVTCPDCFEEILCDVISEHRCLSGVDFHIQYTCPICSLGFTEKNNFILHLASYLKEYTFINVDASGQVVNTSELAFLEYAEASKLMNMFLEDKVHKIIEVHSCEVCDYIAESFDFLSEHCIQNHSLQLVKESLVCPVCSEEWDLERRSSFYEHLKEHKSEGFSFVNVSRRGTLIKDEQSDVFDHSEVLWNLLLVGCQVHSGEVIAEHRLTCDLCHKQFMRKIELVRHFKSHQPKFDCFICEKCGKKCKGKGKYLKHFEKHTAKKPRCTICSKTFSNKISLNMHMNQHKGAAPSGNSCEKCGKVFLSATTLAKHKRQHEEKENIILKCDICEKEFFKQTTFNRHKSAHLNPKYLECEKCNLLLYSSAGMQKHQEMHQNTDKTFDCRICGISFLTKDSLTAHESRLGHYDNRKPFECNVCHEKFLIAKKFTQHIKTHPKYKMDACSLCGKRLATMQSLMMHMNRHFECNYILCPHCGKRFHEERNFKRHLLTHEGTRPFSCNFENCSKAFYTLFELNRHKRYHNKTRNFACTYCLKSFYESNHLTVHVRTHTGERPYTCPHCNKSFITRTRCKDHIKYYHQGIGYDLIRSSISKKVPVFKNKPVQETS